MSQNDEPSPHRLFAAIVLMGTGLAVGCGGISQSDGQVNVGGSSGAGAGTSAGGNPNASGTGGNPNASGTGSATGGMNAGGSLVTTDVGGSAPQPMPVDPGPFDCPPAQWDCPSQSCSLFPNGWALPSGCKCDPYRPVSADQCKTDQVFVCLNALSTADGQPLMMPVPLSCSCISKGMNCGQQCDAAFGLTDLRCVDQNDDEHSAMCGCAVVYLR